MNTGSSSLANRIAIASWLWPTPTAHPGRASSVHGSPAVVSENNMKKARPKAVDADTLQPEYDFSDAVRGVTAPRYAEGANVVLLDPDVAKVFPTARAVNEALRTLVRIRRKPTRSGRHTKRLTSRSS